ncbi:MAG: hypothetical protein KDC74_00755 [Flavobacteriaceae bacterium]|nr:hypothetical protein [Flavobacteriaceae bacterium]
MKKSKLSVQIDLSKINNIRSELKNRQEKLIKFAYDQNLQMDDLDRENIIDFFENGNIPKRPEGIPNLMKSFLTCCFSYAPLRKYLTSIERKIPTPDRLPNCLAEIYSEEKFLIHDNWTPNRLHDIANNIQKKERYNLESKKFKNRMISVILSGTQVIEGHLKNGLDKFYIELNALNRSSSEVMWNYVLEFQKHIYNVGPALICDFLKDIGCDRFVKVDHHFKREFPYLLGLDDCKKLSSKEHFILSQKISDSLNLSPFHLDHLLYQWGRYKKYDR